MKKIFGLMMLTASLALNGCGDNPDASVEFISIPAGSFVSSISDTTVNIEAFQLAKTPTTVAQFEACVDDGACTKQYFKYKSKDSRLLEFCNYARGDDWLKHPMNCVSWDVAKEYCEWIGGRLPTADEWEYAATHDGTQALQTTYPWGDDAPTHCIHASYQDYEDDAGDYCNETTPVQDEERLGTAVVGTYSPQGDSPLGLQDMIGNVWEWTSTLHESNGDAYYYIMMGASWRHDIVLGIFHAPNLTELSEHSVGFRCAK